MFESLTRIQNPVARSVTAALTTLSVITLASAIVIGASRNPWHLRVQTSINPAIKESADAPRFARRILQSL